MKVILNTGSTINQGKVTKGGKKMTPQYTKEAAFCSLNPEDFKKVWYRKGSYLENVKVKTKSGSVTVYAKSDDGLKRGQAFIPRGLWANMVISSETFDSGSPFYKGMEAKVEGTDDPVLDCENLMKKQILGGK
ncbi:MAG: hypothetical protein L6243_04785 [Candidatus Altiarchaeales archaeon]|nr:formylmethanofuran dehydrogenase [Candidatus Altiarchaeota archaeon]MBU4267194.1 formylmethanofuran dehydrogenase [Candidatus Altiarchaeota archaeon]MBU4341773.1 formylmethanofuran dehydrogenase [Candidatus Altiarchaeota archaeon]MBU4437655.1 formylmethanofuran dehydrogenase [Candidatus Altiarchaeota archaeon]MCG2782885.1 hypothetical protein [Candidatus Altiarchaeales archaeon]